MKKVVGQSPSRLEPNTIHLLPKGKDSAAGGLV